MAGRPWSGVATGSPANEMGRAKRHRGLGRAFSPAFRAGSLDRVGAEQSGAASMVSAGAMLRDRFKPPGRCSGCWPHDGEVAGGAVADFCLVSIY
jgi:hypothetical protein